MHQQAAEWKEAETLKEKERLEKLSGVRWTALHELPYWDPVRHVVLGFMHNWLEGILQHHLRVLWGVGRKVVNGDNDDDDDDDEDGLDDLLYESDVTETESELEGLYEEAVEFRQSASSSRSLDAASTQSSPPISRTPSNSSIGTPTAGDDPEDDPDDYQYLDVPDAYDLPQLFLDAIRACIHNVSLPTWVGRPPSNLGEAKHGKLKANDYLVLFSFILPLIVPEFWHGPAASEFDKVQLETFSYLVICTNIVCSFKTSNADADCYTDLYIKYRRNIQRLFPYWPSKPNHHFGVHNGPILKYWGPLPPVGEFLGERIIGQFQNIKTNNKIRKSIALPNE